MALRSVATEGNVAESVLNQEQQGTASERRSSSGVGVPKQASEFLQTQ